METDLRNVIDSGATPKKRGRKPLTDEQRESRRLALIEYHKQYYKDHREQMIQSSMTSYYKHRDDTIPDDIAEARRVAHREYVRRCNKKNYDRIREAKMAERSA